MTAVVSLRALVDEMEMLSDEMRAFVNRRTGELYSSTNELLGLAQDGDDEEELGWQGEILDKLREIVESPDWVVVPARPAHEEYRVMERFCLERCEGRLQEELLSAINGRGAFGRFKDCIHRRGVQEDWYAFRREALAEEAAAWLEAEGIPYGP
jgi:hypothetical protein